MQLPPVPGLHDAGLSESLAREAAAQLGCCLGSPGPMYMVACVVRNWAGKSAGVGKRVPGPPFDDRCVAVAGVCGATCGADFKFHSSEEHCEAGIIPQVRTTAGRGLSKYDT